LWPSPANLSSALVSSTGAASTNGTSASGLRPCPLPSSGRAEKVPVVRDTARISQAGDDHSPG
jgi:hypothetical protein